MGDTDVYSACESDAVLDELVYVEWQDPKTGEFQVRIFCDEN